MRSRPRTNFLALLAISSAAAAAQPLPGLERVEPGFGDVGADVTGRRDLRNDLRRSGGFDAVYKLERTDAFGRTDDIFLRMGGGITAVFPRSTYRPTREGVQAEIPPGTVFHLGRPPEPPPRPATPPQNRVNLALPAGPLNLEAAAALPPAAPAEPSLAAAPTDAPYEPPSIFEDEDFRRRRVASLLNKAANAPGPLPRFGHADNAPD